MAEFKVNDQSEATVGANLNAKGKYSTVTVTPDTHGYKGKVAQGIGTLGVRSGMEANNYSDSPILGVSWKGKVTGEAEDIDYSSEATLKDWFMKNVVKGTVNDAWSGIKSPDGGDFSLEFASAPDLEKVPTGGGGLPSTPYTPNLQSSPESDYTKQPVMNADDVKKLKEQDDGNTFVGQKITEKANLATVAGKVVAAATPPTIS